MIDLTNENGSIPAEIAPFMLLGRCCKQRASENANDKIVGIGLSGYICKADYTDVEFTAQCRGKNLACIAEAFEMLDQECSIGDISKLILAKASILELVAANLVYASAFHHNLGAWHRFVYLYFYAHGLEPNRISRSNKSNRIAYFADQYNLSRRTTANIDDEVSVSVIIAVCNAAETLDYSIASIRSQSHNNLDIIIVNDNSQDHSIDIIRKHQGNDKRIKVINLQQRSGPYVCRNIALEYVTGKYITCHDADDWSHPDRISIQLANLKQTCKLGSMCYMLRVSHNGVFTRSATISDICHDGVLRLCFSSLFVETSIFKTLFGQWDSVYKAADSEMVERIKSYDTDSLVFIKKPLVLALDSLTGISQELSSKNETLLQERIDYKSSFKSWHQRDCKWFPLMKSLLIHNNCFTLEPRLFEAPSSFIPAGTANFLIEIAQSKDFLSCTTAIKSEQLKFQSRSKQEQEEESAKSLWDLKESLLDNPRLAVENIHTYDQLKVYLVEAKRQGLIALVSYISGIFINKGFTDQSVIKMQREADLQLAKLGFDTSLLASTNMERIIMAQRDVLVLDRLSQVWADRDDQASHANDSSKTNIALIINSLGPGGAEKQLVSWCELLKNSQFPQFNVTAVILNSSQKHNLQLLSQILSEDRIKFLDLAPTPTDSDLLDIASNELRSTVQERLDILKLLSSRTRLKNTLKLIVELNVGRYDAVFAFLDEPFISSLLASLVIRPTRCISRFGSMPRLIGRDLTYKEMWKASNRYSFYSHLPEHKSIAIGANSSTCLHEYHKIINRININQSPYIHLPNYISSKLLRANLGDSSLDSLDSQGVLTSLLALKNASKSLTIVGALMRLSEEKRPLVYLSLAKKLSSKDVVFLLIGSGPLDSEVSQMIASMNTDFVIHIPTIQAVSRWYELIDVICLTSSVEGSPNVLLEAALMECAIFSTNVGGVSESFQDEYNAVIVSEDASIECMANRLQDVIVNRDKRRRLARSAQETVKSAYDGRNLIRAIYSFCKTPLA